MSIVELFRETPIIPVVRIEQAEDAEPLARALAAAGLVNIEVSLRTEAAYQAISNIRQYVPSAVAGAGNITEAAQIDKAIQAGAHFLVSPGITPTLAKACQNISVPYLPGGMSASDAMMAQAYGYPVMKFFPVEPIGGVAVFEMIADLFPDMQFCPSGGVKMDHILHYTDLPHVLSVMSRWVAPPERIATKDWRFITALAKKMLGLTRE